MANLQRNSLSSKCKKRKYLLSKALLRWVFVCLVILAAGCSSPAVESLQFIVGDVEVDPLFQDYFASLGGPGVLGPAISPLFKEGQRSYQYTLAGMMAHDPSAPEERQYSMAPLGLAMGVAQPSRAAFPDSGLRYVGGHTIDPAIVPYFDRLGRRVVGEPITEARYNPGKKRYEQFFSNLGFYRLEGDPQGAVALLAYGLWKCGASCNEGGAGDAEVVLPVEVGDVFVDTVERLGTDFTGFALRPSYETPEGYSEQIFENIVLLAGASADGGVTLRPLSERLDIQPEPLVGAGSGNTVFVAVEEDQGHNVPQVFMDYISARGGLEVSGLPVEEAARAGQGVTRQCFTNLCLEEHRNEAGALRIRPASLGYVYAQLPLQPLLRLLSESASLLKTGIGGQPEDAPAEPKQIEASNQPLALEAWVLHPQLAAGEIQEIRARVLQGETPLAGVEPDLVVTLPDGSETTYYMYPSGEDGVSWYALEPMDFNRASSVRFRVCVYNRQGKTTCVRDSFSVQAQP